MERLIEYNDTFFGILLILILIINTISLFKKNNTTGKPKEKDNSSIWPDIFYMLKFCMLMIVLFTPKVMVFLLGIIESVLRVIRHALRELHNQALNEFKNKPVNI